MVSQDTTNTIVRFDSAMNMARNILAKEVSVSARRIISIRKFSLISEFIEKNTFDIKSPIIHFLSAYEDEDADKIAIDLAIILSEKYGKKVLLVDACAKKQEGFLHDMRNQAEISINDLCTENVPNATPFLNVERTTFFYASLVDVDANDGKLVDITTLKKFLLTARANFDYVIIASERSIARSYPFSFAAMAQLNVLVVSASKTRKQVLSHMVKAMSDMEAVVSATILTHRKYFIPQFLYKLLFSAGV